MPTRTSRNRRLAVRTSLTATALGAIAAIATAAPYETPPPPQTQTDLGVLIAQNGAFTCNAVGTLDVTIVVNGPDPAARPTSVVITMPPQMPATTVAAPGWDVDNQGTKVVLRALADLPAGFVQTLRVHGVVKPGSSKTCASTFTASATVANANDHDATNNEAQARISVANRAVSKQRTAAVLKAVFGPKKMPSSAAVLPAISLTG